MGEVIWFGTVLGAVVGALHCVQFLISNLGQTGRHSIRTLWHALWILALWTVFGAYVLAFWLLGAVVFILSRPFQRPGAER